MTELVTSKRYPYRGKLLSLRVAKVRLPNGLETTREVVEHPGAVAIIPLLDDQRIVVTKQYRIAAGRQLLEIPAGTLEKGESPVSCAKRELVEETGYSARRIRKAFSCYLAPGYSTERIHFFVAGGLARTEAQPEEDEAIATRTIRLNDGLKAIEKGAVQDAKTICALYYLATHVGQHRKRKRHRSTE